MVTFIYLNLYLYIYKNIYINIQLYMSINRFKYYVVDGLMRKYTLWQILLHESWRWLSVWQSH